MHKPIVLRVETVLKMCADVTKKLDPIFYKNTVFWKDLDQNDTFSLKNRKSENAIYSGNQTKSRVYSKPH